MPDKAVFFEWLAETQLLDFPEAGSPLRTMLAKDAIKCNKVQTFRDMIRFVVWAMAEHSSYGTRMFATQTTLAEGFGCSPRTVRRYLAGAQAVGVVRVVREGDRFAGVSTEYDIARFWEDAVPTYVPDGWAQGAARYGSDDGQAPPY